MEKTNEAKPVKKFKGRGRDTLYRVTLHNQINLISIADQKANIIIGINTVIISLIIAILGSRWNLSGSEFLKNVHLHIPLIILMLSCLASEIFSVIAARPVKPQIEQGKQGIMYSRNLDLMNVDEYLHEVGEIIKSGKDVYENLSVDMYYQGKAINRKFRLLRFSYTIFLIGLIISVVCFFIVFFTS